MALHISKDPVELSHSLATWITNYIEEVLVNHQRFTWALSGGNTPKLLYETLSQPSYAANILWERVHIFFGDERYVPFNDELNNGRMAFDSLLKHVPVPYEQIHFMRTDMDVETSAITYEKLLHHYFDGKQNSFDLVLLGMGEDGHTLSLFPHSQVKTEPDSWVKSIYFPEQKMQRITLTPSIVNRAKRISFLVSGKNKAVTLKNVLNGKPDPEKFPAQLIRPESGEIHWFVDEAAASQLDQTF